MEVLKLLIWQLETQKMLQPLTPSPPHVTNNGKHVHVQIINKLDFMQILCHRKERKVGKKIKMLGRGVGRILSWVGEYTPLFLIPPKTQEEEWALHKLWGGGGEDSACGRPNYQQICRTALWPWGEPLNTYAGRKPESGMPDEKDTCFPGLIAEDAKLPVSRQVL